MSRHFEFEVLKFQGTLISTIPSPKNSLKCPECPVPQTIGPPNGYKLSVANVQDDKLKRETTTVHGTYLSVSAS